MLEFDVANLVVVMIGMVFGGLCIGFLAGWLTGRHERRDG